MKKYQKGEYVFLVKETDEGEPWIMPECRSEEGVRFIDEGILGLKLRKGLSYEDAREIANLLNDKIGLVTYTVL